MDSDQYYFAKKPKMAKKIQSGTILINAWVGF